MVDEGKKSLEKGMKVSVIKPFEPITEEELEERNKIMKPLEEQLIKQANEENEESPAMVKAEKKEKDAEEKIYVILFVFEGDNYDENTNWWQKVTGRTAAYECIKTNIDSCNIHDSFILVEGLPLEKCVSIYEFMRHVKEKGYFEDSFDIEDYNNGYEESTEYSDQSLVDGIPDMNGTAPTSITSVNPFTHLNANEQDV